MFDPFREALIRSGLKQCVITDKLIVLIQVISSFKQGSISLMKKLLWQRLIFSAVILTFSLMLGGKAIACFAPSTMEMGRGKTLDCCMERCRMETTQEAAKQACEKSLLAFSQQEMRAHSDKNCAYSPELILSDFNPLPLFSTTLFEPDDPLDPVQNEPPIQRHASTVPIYTAIQTFLI